MGTVFHPVYRISVLYSRVVTEPTAGAQHVALAVVSRRRLLELLQATDEQLDVVALAAAVGLHVTTARFHLDVLERSGLVRRAVERVGRRGRPRQLYSAAVMPEVSAGYRQLAAVLVGGLTADLEHGPQRAELAGRRWAEEALPPGEGLSWEEGTRRVDELFDRLGFAPRLVDDGQYRHLELDGCPFRDLARADPRIVCTVHLGLLRGALHQLRLPGAAQGAGLRPFVGPELCIADIPRPSSKKGQRCPEPAH